MKASQCSAIMIFLLLLTACASTPLSVVTDQVSPLNGVSPIPTIEPTLHKQATEHTPQGTPMPSKSAIAGQVISISSAEPLSGTTVRLARVFWNEQKTDGAFALEASSSPSTITNKDGTFLFLNIEPADYIIVVGELQGTNVILSESDGKARVFTAEQGKTTKVGKLQVDLEP